MKLKELLPFCVGLIKLQVYTCGGNKTTLYASHVTQYQFAKYSDFEVYKIRATHDNEGSTWLEITVKEYHAHL